MQDYVTELLDATAKALPALRALGDESSASRPAPGRWSPREIIGHLIDSASHNHRRFVTARWSDDLVFDGYDQDAFVSAQHYDQAPWTDLLDLWASFNRHLARVMAATPADVRAAERRRHNLDQIAWRPVPASEPATLDYLMSDYVGHLRHHLAQIVGGPAGRA
ncbi:MAG TPA: DinB family protein [Vicinamibacterales bacterium]|jgi:hypothetical protein